MGTTAKLYFDTRREKADGTYPVKIQIIHERKQKYFGTTYSYSKEEFKKIMSGFRLSETQYKDKLRIDALIQKANEIIVDLIPFSFDAFELRFTSKGNRKDLIYLLRQKADAHEKTEGINSSNINNQTANLLQAYSIETTGETELKIGNVTPEWLKAFEVWASKQVQKNGKQKFASSTINTYLTRVRTIFNDVIDKGELSISLYPFHRTTNKKGYKLPPVNNNKRALTKEEIMKIYTYKTIVGSEVYARDMFLFSYLGSGMNMTDVYHLKWSDIKGNQFSFVRKKTEKKTRGANRITIALTPELQQIIDTHGSHKLNNDYIFNVLDKNMTAKEVTNKIKKAITLINTNLKKIAKTLGVTGDISTYYARHSFATILMINGGELLAIQQQLGHADAKTTQNYLGSFPSEKIKEYHSVLLDKIS